MKKFIFSILLLLTAFSLKAEEGDTITFKSKNMLEWSDFKMIPNINDSSKVYLDVTIVTFPKKVNVWTGIISVESYAGIKRDSSWIKPQYKSPQLLDYVQLKYEIANYFAKKSEQAINKKKINVSFTNRITKIVKLHIESMNQVFKEFDVESDFGNNAEVFDNWKTKIEKEKL